MFYFNKSDITPTVLDGKNEINLQIGQMINVSYALLTMIFQ